MATAAPDAAAPAGGSKKKLIMMIVIGLVVLLVAAAAALMLLKKKPAEDEDAEEEETSQVVSAKPKPGAPPVYLPLDPFTVNLTDKDVDRYAQVGVNLEVVDQKTADMLKSYMPSIRSGVLMVLAHKSAAELLTKEGKERLQKEIQREAVRPLGIEVELDDETSDEDAAPKKKKKRKKAPSNLPVTNVLFSQFIVQ